MAETKFGMDEIDALLAQQYSVKRLFSLRPLQPKDERRLRANTDSDLQGSLGEAGQQGMPTRLPA
jgi:hypothetical protein